MGFNSVFKGLRSKLICYELFVSALKTKQNGDMAF